MVDTMNVYIYPNNSSQDQKANIAKNAIENAIDQAQNYFSQSGEQLGSHVEIRDSYPDIDTNLSIPFQDQKSTILGNFGSNIALEDSSADTGAHLFIGSGFGGGLAGGGLGGAWRNNPRAVSGSDDNNPHFKNSAIHEILHLFLNIGKQITATGSPRSEHILGEVIPTSSGPKQTPMVNSYADTLASEGDCDRYTPNPGHTTQLTICTLDSLLQSYRSQGEVL